MTKRVVIIRHVDCEGPGYLLTVLERHGLPYEIIAVDQGHEIPDSANDMLAIVSMGGGMSVNDQLPWIEKEVALLQEAKRQNVPVLGHCLGAQLMAKALGAEVVANAETEIGWFDISPTQELLTSPYLSSISFPVNVFHWHGETFTLPAGATNLLRSEACANQCFYRDNWLGFQCHIEMTEPMVIEWLNRFGDQIDPNQRFQQNPDRIQHELHKKVENLNAIADIIYTQWIKTFST